jgi:hypothetical protein
VHIAVAAAAVGKGARRRSACLLTRLRANRRNGTRVQIGESILAVAVTKRLRALRRAALILRAIRGLARHAFIDVAIAFRTLVVSVAGEVAALCLRATSDATVPLVVAQVFQLAVRPAVVDPGGGTVIGL